MPSIRRLAFASVLLAALAVVPAAHARVVLVATGDSAATLTDVTTNKVVARIPVGARSRAAAIAPDGTRGYVAAGRRVAAHRPRHPPGRGRRERGRRGDGARGVGRRPAPVRGAARRDRRHRRADDDAEGIDRARREGDRRGAGDLRRRHARGRRSSTPSASASSTSCASACRAGRSSRAPPAWPSPPAAPTRTSRRRRGPARGWSASTPTPAGSRAGSAWARAWAAASR